jgi:hypothetical protein
LQVPAIATHLDTISSILNSLLNDRVFEPEEKVSKFFLELFAILPLELLAGRILKKRKILSGRAIKRGRTLQIGSTDGSRLGSTDSICSYALLSES